MFQQVLEICSIVNMKQVSCSKADDAQTMDKERRPGGLVRGINSVEAAVTQAQQASLSQRIGPGLSFLERPSHDLLPSHKWIRTAAAVGHV